MAMTSQSTPVSQRPVAPSFPVSKLSDSNCGCDRQSESEPCVVTRYLEEANTTQSSFLDISFECMDDVKESSYMPSSTADSEEVDAEEENLEDEHFEDEDGFEDDDEDFILDMSLHLDEETISAPIKTPADMVFHLADNEEETNIEEDLPTMQEDRNFITEEKSICFEKDLLRLGKLHVPAVCDRKACSGLVTASSKKIGTAVCVNSHVVKIWDSQPIARRMRVGDILLSSAILTSGNNFDKINLMFKFLGLGMTSKTTHYKLQTSHFCPVIHDEFNTLLQHNIEKYAGHQVVVAGDGRMASPGHSAQYCTYTMMEHETKDILASIIIDKRMTDLKSTAMEVEGLRRGMKFIQDCGVEVVELVTDASTKIAAMMRKEHPNIRHSFDTWHGAKNFGKKIGAVAAETRKKELRPWVPDLINHFWYCSRIAGEDEDIMLGKWRGALHHVSNVHEWLIGDDAIVPRCDHDELDTTETKWLEPAGTAHSALMKVMLDPRFLHTLHHYANFRHTGELENLHEHILMYCAKRFAYTYPTYKARNYLAMLDYMYHKDRAVLVDKNGETRLDRCFSKRKGTFSVYPEKVPKTYSYATSLLEKLLTSVLT